MSFEVARAVADAVLLEGYLLYPYRASAAKNRYRFTFGVLAPRAWADAGGCEACWMEAQCLVEPLGTPEVDARLRFLQLRRRRVEEASAGEPDELRPVEAIDGGGKGEGRAGDRRVSTWDEGDVREIDVRAVLADAGERVVPFEVMGGRAEEPVAREGTSAGPGGAAAGGDRGCALDREPCCGQAVAAAGGVTGRIVQRRWPLCGTIRLSAEPVAADRPLLRLRVRVENETPWQDPSARRDEVLRASLLASHLLLAVRGGAFVSLLDPPPWARAAARACTSVRTYPVLVGDPRRRDLVLSAPIILYDHPRVAPESQGDFFDATEIDELLTLRTATLTEAEKLEARATDPRAAALLDRVDHLPPELARRLHGAIRGLERAEMVPRADAPESAPAPRGDLEALALQAERAQGRGPAFEEHGPEPAAGIGPGSSVRLKAPGARRTDAQDALYAGHIATVRKVMRDVDGETILAVTIDDDPAAELHEWYGRFHYYRLDEVEPMAREVPSR